MRNLLLTFITFLTFFPNSYSQQQDCPYKLVDLELIESKYKIHYNPLLSPDLKHLIIYDYPSLILTDTSCNFIDTICDYSAYIKGCKWLNDTIVRYRLKKKIDGYFTYNIKTKQSKPLAKNQFKYIEKPSSNVVSLYFNGEMKQVLVTSNRISEVTVSPDSSRVLMKIDNNINVYNITRDSIEFIGKLDHRGSPVGWLADSNYFLYFIDKDDGHTYLESDYYIATFDCGNFWKITDTEKLFEGRGSLVKDVLYFNDIANGKTYKCRLIKN